VLVVIGGVGKLAPENRTVSPVDVLNHSYFPPGAVADKMVLLPGQTDCPFAVGAAGVLLIIIVTCADLGPQAPGGSFYVNVSVAEVSPAAGV
jgi:hypothetical protein